MCGLVGMYGAIFHKEEEMFKDMLIVDQVRGTHSTGVASVNNKNHLIIAKGLELPPELFLTTDFTRIISRHGNNLLLGHNRHATKGEINDLNAHPFHHGHIVGAHNGTIRAVHRLLDHNEFGTDSEALIHHISKRGIDDLWKNMQGAAALSFYNMQSRKLTLVRNQERPLCFGVSEDERTLIWASEWWMIETQAFRHRVKLHESVVFLKPDHMYQFYIQKGKVMVEGRKLPPFVVAPESAAKPAENENKPAEYDTVWWEGNKKYRKTKDGKVIVRVMGQTWNHVKNRMEISEGTVLSEETCSTGSYPQLPPPTSEATKAGGQGKETSAPFPRAPLTVQEIRARRARAEAAAAVQKTQQNGNGSTNGRGTEQDTESCIEGQEMLDVSFFNPLDNEDKEKRKKKAESKAKKFKGRLRALKRRANGKVLKKDKQLLIDKANADADWYLQYSVNCYYCSGYMDPDTALVIDEKTACCEECTAVADAQNIKLWSLKGA